ncbi:hypothetical protein PPTG_23494 [Phytophthora nicotianae INRA-310]|uniref:HTH CENPB-type domain-containing protein n=1 Tax=Phytophthora nicotianae (strain INRA-310) TaxID=761204 RepID=W2PWH8_PHYN3|nr:hypothetical protein PPTG_23494 [Phytophthora nicotianae INRA-310]ETN05293.1 hypothetical protein PPTG_23494 [Phytophthora nicotianae INRA-310]
MTRQLYEALNERDVTGKEISFTAGWLSAFKVRHDLKRVWLHGEGASANSEAVSDFFARVQPNLF